MSKSKKIIFKFFLFFTPVSVPVVFFLFLLFNNRKSYNVAEESIGAYNSRIDEDLKIGIIGDSWAAGKKLDELLRAELRSLGLNADVFSYGHPGGKSRDVLRDLCENREASSILNDKRIDVFVLMVGVNDSKGHDGPDFYGFHVEQLFKLILSHGALAVILDVPNYGIESIEVPSFAFWAKRQASRILFDSGNRDNRAEYRKILADLSGKHQRVYLLPSGDLPSFYNEPELWQDPLHLNVAGYERISKPVALAVSKLYKSALAARLSS